MENWIFIMLLRKKKRVQKKFLQDEKNVVNKGINPLV